MKDFMLSMSQSLIFNLVVYTGAHLSQLIYLAHQFYTKTLGNGVVG